LPTTLKPMSEPAKANKAMRAELAKAFPGIKFQGASEIYSGGSSVNIRWNFGPTTKQVQAITDKYQDGDFNGMEDIYEYRRNRPATEGSAKYVFENRDYFEPVFTQIARDYAALLGDPLPDGTAPWNHMVKAGGQKEWLASMTNQLLAVYEFPAGWTYQGMREAPGEYPRAAGHVSEFYEIIGGIRHPRY